MAGFPEQGVLPPLLAGTRCSIVSTTQLLTTSRVFILRLLPARIMVQQYDGANLRGTLQPLPPGRSGGFFWSVSLTSWAMKQASRTSTPICTTCYLSLWTALTGIFTQRCTQSSRVGTTSPSRQKCFQNGLCGLGIPAWVWCAYSLHKGHSKGGGGVAEE